MVHKNDLFSLRNRIEHGRTVGHIAAFLTRTEAEIREKAAELGLKASSRSDRRLTPIFKRVMSATGQQRTSASGLEMSAYPLGADMRRVCIKFGLVPKADATKCLADVT